MALIASAIEVDPAFVGAIASALTELRPRAPSPIERLRFAVSGRFVRRNREDALRLIEQYLSEECAAMRADPAAFRATFILEAPSSPADSLSFLIRLDPKPGGALAGYGCSTRRLAEDAYVVDLHSPFFGLVGRTRRVDL